GFTYLGPVDGEVLAFTEISYNSLDEAYTDNIELFARYSHKYAGIATLATFGSYTDQRCQILIGAESVIAIDGTVTNTTSNIMVMTGKVTKFTADLHGRIRTI